MWFHLENTVEIENLTKVNQNFTFFEQDWTHEQSPTYIGKTELGRAALYDDRLTRIILILKITPLVIW